MPDTKLVNWVGKIAGYYLVLVLITGSFWTYRYFGTVTIEQAFSTINFGIKGAFTVDSIYWHRLFNWCVFWPSIITTCLVLAEAASIRLFSIHFRYYLHYAFLAIGIAFFVWEFNLFEFLKNQRQHKDDYFLTAYTNPNTLSFQTKNPKDLVLIYVESLESTYANKTIFTHNLLQSLHQLDYLPTLSFTDYQQMPGTGWTIAGIISTQCGLPLKTLFFDGNRFGENVKSYLPKAKCLGDILAEQGYKNVFLQGASLDFSGKGKFLKAHHYSEIYGKEEWLKQGISSNKMGGWGLSDDELFAQARVKLNKLMRNKQHFNLTILTVDMHGPDMHLSETCRKQGYNDPEGIVECTANQVSSFVSYIKDKGWMDRINIVILGDHLAMRNPLYDKLNTLEQRSIFNLFISNKSYQKKREQVVHFDMLPTILDFLGIAYPNSQVGLGYSAMRTIPEAEKLGRLEKMQENIAYESKAYNDLWLPNTATQE